MQDPKPHFDTHLISTFAEFERLIKYEVSTPDQELIVIDTETNSKEEKLALLYGIGLCLNTKKAFYIPWRKLSGDKWWTSAQEATIIGWLDQVCLKRKVIGYNILYDVLVIENNLSIVLDSLIYSDPILQKHTLDEEPPFALKECAVKKLGNWANKAQEALYENIKKNGGKTTKEQMEMYKADTIVLAEYCCWDVILTLMMFRLYEKELEVEGLLEFFYREEVMPLYKLVTIPMKRKGFPVNVGYFKNLKSEIDTEINRLEDEIQVYIKEDVEPFCKKLLEEDFGVSNNGSYPKEAAKYLDIPLPVMIPKGKITTDEMEKTLFAEKAEEKVTLAAKHIQKQMEQSPEHSYFYNWIIGNTESCPLTEEQQRKVSEQLYFKKNPDKRHVFNLRSNDHLIALFIDILGYPVKERTEGGKPQINDDYLEDYKSNPLFEKIVDFKKLNKIQSTYVEGILDRQLDGVIYTSMLQFGTTSGRYSSRNPNLQNQPRIKDEDSGISPLVLKYVNAIKKGFVPPKGYKIVNADYSALEPRAFSHVSGDQKLIEVWKKGEDLYSRIAIDVFKLKNVSANPKDSNYLKKINPEYRQSSKVFCLAVVYGAEEFRIAEAMKCSKEESRQVIRAYLGAYPGLRTYMKQCDFEAKQYGQVKTEFGRVRHIQAAKRMYTIYGDDILDYRYAKTNGYTEQRWKYKNLLNNAKNFKIQGLAAHIVNKAMINLSIKFKENQIDGWIALQVHDEITCIVREDQAELAAKLLKDAMENTTKISVDLIAEPIIGDNWADAK